jgi:hypothetical protein
MNEDGFEYQGVFYPWHVSDVGKDLRLIDHFTGMPVAEFFEAVQDSFDNGRGPILLALLATSIRHLRQDWSVERIARMVDGLSLSDVEFVESGEGGDDVPPPSAGERPASKPESPPTSFPRPDESQESETSEQLYASPA